MGANVEKRDFLILGSQKIVRIKLFSTSLITVLIFLLTGIFNRINFGTKNTLNKLFLFE